MSTTRRRRPPVADHDANIASDSTLTSTHRRSSPIRGAASDTTDQSRRHDSTQRGRFDDAAVVILVVSALLFILLQKFSFGELPWVVYQLLRPPLLVAVPALIMILPISMVVEWVRDGSKVARAPTTTGRVGGEGNDSRISREESANRDGPRKFTYKELVEATNSFASDLKLGRGASGTVYKGHIGNDREPVAVKIITSGASQGVSDFIAEVVTLFQLSHTNLVKLKGFCHERDKTALALVYEYIGRGTLSDYLFKPDYFLTWENRYNIALGLASALRYLRRKQPQWVIHRDVKSSNVMLDEAFVAKLGDFGLATLVNHIGVPNSSLVAGTPGYWAPEYVRMGVLSRKSDIYSFGVVLLEIVCGREAISPDRNPRNLVEWVWRQYGPKKLRRAVDSRLGKDFNRRQAKALMMTGLWCAHPDAKLRPSIKMATAYLNLTAVPPELPPEMPAFPY